MASLLPPDGSVNEKYRTPATAGRSRTPFATHASTAPRSTKSVRSSRNRPSHSLCALAPSRSIAASTICCEIIGFMVRESACQTKTLESLTPQNLRRASHRNPHPKGTLAYAAWVIARLGAWDGYYGKPGPKVMRLGLQDFQLIKYGHQLGSKDV